jgi:hypothetical protein
MPAQYPTDGRATNPEQIRELFVAEPTLVEGPDDRFAQVRWGSHPNRRSQFADHINRIAGQPAPSPSCRRSSAAALLLDESVSDVSGCTGALCLHETRPVPL